MDRLPDIHFGEVDDDLLTLPDVEGDEPDDAPAGDDLIELLGFNPDDEDDEPLHDLIPKADVGYEHPAKGKDHCGGCVFFQSPDACALVEPPIQPEDWCELHDDPENFAADMARDDGGFQEQQHPRGQPDNPGQFVKKGEGGSKHKAAPGATIVNPVAKVLKAHGYVKGKGAGSNVFTHESGHEVEVHPAHEGQKWLTGWTHDPGLGEKLTTKSGAGALNKHLTAVHKKAPPKESVQEALQPVGMFEEPTPPKSATKSYNVKPPADLVKKTSDYTGGGGIYVFSQKENNGQYIEEPAVEHTLKTGEKLVVGKETGVWNLDDYNGKEIASGKGQEALNAALVKHTTASTTEPVSIPQGQGAFIQNKQSAGHIKYEKGEANGEESTNYYLKDGSVLYTSNESPKWMILDKNGDITHQGEGQQSLNEAFEQLHPRGAGGKFIEKAKSQTGPTPSHPPPTKAVGKTLNQSDLKKVGPQQGSNPGGVYEDKSGKQYYLKEPQTVDHARNEILAAALMRAAGGNTLDYHQVVNGDKMSVATDLVKLDKDNISQLTPSEKAEAQKDFAIQAWLGNWDAAGIDGSNIGVVNGKPTALDLGGALKYRAQGSPKVLKFDAPEWESLRNSSINPKTAQLYGNMTPAQLKESVAKLNNITPIQINDLVQQYGPGDISEKAQLVKTLITRRNVIVKKADEEAKAATEPMPTPSTTSFPTWTAEYKKQIENAPKPTASEAYAISRYSGGDYQDWNNNLRNSFGNDAGKYTTDNRHLQSYLAKASLPEEITVKRAVSGNFAKHILAESEDDEHTFTDHGFASSDDWSGQVRIQITLPKGAQAAAIGHYSKHPGENEILIQAGSKYKAYKYDADQRIIYARLVRSGPPKTGVKHE